MDTIHIYTDGACSGNPGPGGAAAILIRDNKIYHRVGRGYKMTTNNRMEILAVTYGAKAALQRISEPSEIVFHTDSQIVYGACALGWKKNANKDLWKELDTVLADLRKTHQVRFEKAKGHSNDRWNDEVDALAVKLRMMPQTTLLDDVQYGSQAPTLFQKSENRPLLDTKETAGRLIKKYADESQVCMAEFLASEPVPAGMSFEKAFNVYIECMKQVEGDSFFTVKENKKNEL